MPLLIAVVALSHRLLGTRWAPINVPTSRRLQTFAVLLALTLMPMNNMMLLCMFFVPFLRQFYRYGVHNQHVHTNFVVC